MAYSCYNATTQSVTSSWATWYVQPYCISKEPYENHIPYVNANERIKAVLIFASQNSPHFCGAKLEVPFVDPSLGSSISLQYLPVWAKEYQHFGINEFVIDSNLSLSLLSGELNLKVMSNEYMINIHDRNRIYLLLIHFILFVYFLLHFWVFVFNFLFKYLLLTLHAQRQVVWQGRLKLNLHIMWKNMRVKKLQSPPGTSRQYWEYTTQLTEPLHLRTWTTLGKKNSLQVYMILKFC